MLNSKEEIQFEDKIRGALKNLRYEINKTARKKKDPAKLKEDEYLWVVFCGTISCKVEDLIAVVEAHKKTELRIKSSLYILLRSILEDYFYIKLLLLEKEKVSLHFRAYLISSNNKQKTLLKSLIRLSEEDKFVLSADDTHITSLSRLQQKIDGYNELTKKLLSSNKELEDLTKVYSSVEEVCKKYDEVKGISKVVKETQPESMQYLYNFIYRFNSGFVHQVLDNKEDVLNLAWSGKNYQDNLEILSLTLFLLKDLKNIRLK